VHLVGLADAALGEGTGVKLHKLSVKEIKAVRRVPIPLSYSSPVLVLSTLPLYTALRHAYLESLSSAASPTTLAALGTTHLQDCSLQSSCLAIYMFCLVAFFTLRVGENRVANLATVYMVIVERYSSYSVVSVTLATGFEWYRRLKVASLQPT